MWERQRDPEGLLKTTRDTIEREKEGFGFDRQRWIGWNEKPNGFRTRHRGDQLGKNKNNKWKRCYEPREKIGGKKPRKCSLELSGVCPTKKRRDRRRKVLIVFLIKTLLQHQVNWCRWHSPRDLWVLIQAVVKVESSYQSKSVFSFSVDGINRIQSTVTELTKGLTKTRSHPVQI